MTMWERLLSLLEASTEVHVLVLGDYMLDHYLYGDAERISPEAPVPVLNRVREEFALGGAGSVAADVAALGAIPHCVGVMGMNADAEELATLLTRAGADVSGLVRSSQRRTTRKTRIVGLAQHKHRQQLIRFDDETRDPVDGPTAKQLLSEVKRQLGQCAVLCIEDYNKGVVTSDVAAAAMELAARRGIPVIVDPAAINDYSRYAGASLITPNRTETERLIDVRLSDIAAVEKHQERILSASKCKQVCVTLDAEGAALIGPGRFEHIPTRKRDVYDVTGAGDEVLAALAVGVALGCSDSEAVCLANIAGGLEVEKFGCVPITRDEIVGEILLEHHRDLGKVRELDSLLPELKRRRAAGEKVAFTNGCYDILHVGHVSTFAFCRNHADIVVVGVNSDDSVRRLGKGEDRPIVGQEDRARVIAALADVDYVVVFDDDTPLSLIEAIRPDVLAKGQDWEGREVVGADVVEKGGGKVLFVPFEQGRSTTNIVDRIRGAGASESETKQA